MAAPTFSDADFQKPEPVQAPENKGSAPEKAGSYISRELLKGAAEQAGANLESAAPLAVYGPLMGLPESLARQFLPRDWVDKIFPLTKNLPGKDTSGAPTTLGKAMLDPKSPISPETMEENVAPGPNEAPGDLSRTIGAGAKALGRTAMNPLGGPAKLVKGALVGLGAGMGGDLGSKALGSGMEAAGGLMDEALGTHEAENAKHAGEIVGSLVGGAAGAQANVLRGKVVTSAYQAMQNAMELKRQRAAGTLKDNLKDNYSAMQSETKGVIQEHVNDRLKKTLEKNPNVQENVTELDEAAKRIGIDPDTFDLAQRTADPALKTAVESQQPRDLKEAQEFARRDQVQKKSIVAAFDKANPRDKATSKDVVDSMEDLRRSTNAKIAAHEAVKKREQDVITHLSPEARKAQGDKIQDLYKEQQDAAKPIRDSWYAEVEMADLQDHKTYDLKGVKKGVGDILDRTLSKMDKSTVPESVVKLDALLKKVEGSADKTTRVEKRPGLFEMETVPGQKGEPATVKDITDIFKALNREIPADATEARNLSLIRNSLSTAFKEQAPKAVSEAFDNANLNYRSKYVPMFKEGVNFNLDRKAGVNRKGEAYYKPDMGMAPYLDETELVTKMQQFDNLFGGQKMGKRSDAAYQELGRAVEDKFHREMFAPNAKFTEGKMAGFMDRFGPVFDRVPEARQRIEQQASKVFAQQGAMDAEKQGFREAMEAPLNKAIGPQKADKLVADALTDPRRMNSLIGAMRPHGGVDALLKDVTGRFNIMQDGMFDPIKMEQVLKDGQPGLMTLFTAQMGPAAAQAHYQTLKDIATVAKRQVLSENRSLPPSQRLSSDPIRSATGSGGASWMSYFRSTSQGYTSTPYIGVLAGGRFLNQSLQNALKDAEVKAFNDPKMARAILEMYGTESGKPVSEQAVRTIMGTGTKGASALVNWMIDRGYIKQNMGKGAQLGLSNYQEERERRERAAGR